MYRSRKRFATQLRTMTDHQRILSENIISDVIVMYFPNYNNQLSYQQQTMAHQDVHLPQQQQ